MPSTRPSHLADFENPPVIEVALGVEFAPLQGLRQAHLGVYWERVRQEYPISEDHPAIPSAPTDIGRVAMPAFRVAVPGAIPPNRTLFYSQTRDKLVQLQQDRFVTNWRGRGESYPHFDALLEVFKERWSDFLSFVQDQGLGAIIPTRIEVNYVNHVDFESPADFLNLAGNFNLSVPELVAAPTDTQLNLRYDSKAGGPADGALLASVNRPLKGPLIPPGQPTDGWFFNLTFRGPVDDPSDLMAVLPLLTHGREVIDHAFVDLTRADIQQSVWRRK